MRRLAPLLSLVLTGVVAVQGVALGQPAPTPLGSASAWALPPLAAPTVVAIPAGSDRIVSLRQGEPAPFTGHLFDPPTAMRWGNFLEQYRVRLDVDVRSERERGQVEAGFWRTRLEQDRGYYLVVIQDQQRQIAQLQLPKADLAFYERSWFAFGLGVVTAGALFGVAAYASHR